jgi:glycerate kinase
MVIELEKGLGNLFSILKQMNKVEVEEPGDGAAGGLGLGLRAFCDATITSGAELVCDAVKLDKHLKGASLLITGEGKTDSQTLSGKLCAIISQHAKKEDVPVLLISGRLAIQEELFKMFDFAFSTSLGESELTELLENAKADLQFTAANTARLFNSTLS